MAKPYSGGRPDRRRGDRVLRGTRVTIAAGEFKARCLQLMDEVAEKRGEVVITKYGKPVARLVAVEDEVPDSFGCMRGTVAYHGDVVAPDHESWDEPAS